MPVSTAKHPAAGLWLLALLLLTAVTLTIATACASGSDGKEAETAAQENSSSESDADREAEEEASLAQDAEMYAEQKDVSLDEAMRRLRLQQDLSSSGLQPELIENEGDSFAGLWIQHEPEYRFVVLFTRDGEEKIQPYIEGEPWADVVEVRNGASATLAELEATQGEAGRIVSDLGIIAQPGIDQQENRVELEVMDRARLEAALREADVRLPEHVEVIKVAAMPEPKTGDAVTASTPPPLVTDLGIVFPTQDTPPEAMPAVGARGVLFVDERGCLRLGDRGDGSIVSSIVPIWPYGYELNAEGSDVVIHDSTGGTVARVGDEVGMTGIGFEDLAPPGNGGMNELQARELAEHCPGPYHEAGSITSDSRPIR